MVERALDITLVYNDILWRGARVVERAALEKR